MLFFIIGCDVLFEMFVLQVNRDLIFLLNENLLDVQCVMVKRVKDYVCITEIAIMLFSAHNGSVGRHT